MARRVTRGEIWLHDFGKPDKRRPVVVLTRQDVIDALHTVTVAPITTTIYGIPSEVVVGLAEGLKHRSAVNLDHLQTIPRRDLERYIGRLDGAKLEQLCVALATALGCDGSARVGHD